MSEADWLSRFVEVRRYGATLHVIDAPRSVDEWREAYWREHDHGLAIEARLSARRLGRRVRASRYRVKLRGILGW